MEIYVGYGFNVNDLSCSSLLELMKNHDEEAYRELQEELEEDLPEEAVLSIMEEGVKDKIEEVAMSVAEYLRDIINAGEKAAAGADDIVSTYDNYLVFDSVRFADDSARTKYIRTEEDFVKMIGRYVNTEALTFGNLYEGSDWIDPNYYLD